MGYFGNIVPLKRISAVALLAGLLAVSCGKLEPKGDILSKDIKVEDFTKIELSGQFRAFYAKADSSFVNIETYENLAGNIKLSSKDNILRITEKRVPAAVDFYNITIYSRNEPTAVTLAQNVELNISSEIKADRFDLTITDDAKFIGSVRSRMSSVTMNKKARANFLGVSKKADIKLSDTASIIAPYWQINTANLQVKNGSYAELQVQDSLKGKVENTAKLVYYEEPVQALSIERTSTVQHENIEELKLP